MLSSSLRHSFHLCRGGVRQSVPFRTRQRSTVAAAFSPPPQSISKRAGIPRLCPPPPATRSSFSSVPSVASSESGSAPAPDGDGGAMTTTNPPRSQASNRPSHRNPPPSDFRSHRRHREGPPRARPSVEAETTTNGRRDGPWSSAASSAQPSSRRWTQGRPLHRMKTPPPPRTPPEWVLVTGVPPASNLSDVLQTLAPSLPSLPSLPSVPVSDGGRCDVEVDGGYDDLSGSDLRWGTLSNALEEGEAEEEPAARGGATSADVADADAVAAASAIVEARLHLSYRARPLGWFLRLRPSVGCDEVGQEGFLVKKLVDLSNAALEAEVEREAERRGTAREKRKAFIKEATKAAREAKSGRGEGEEVGATSVALNEQEDEEEKGGERNEEEELSRTDDNDLDRDRYGDDEDSDPELDGAVIAGSDDENDDESPPSWSSPSPSIACGGKTLRIEAFRPPLPPPPPSSFRRPPHVQRRRQTWEERSFGLIRQLDLSDSVIRVENCSLDTTVDEIQYMFRGYDLAPSWPDDDDRDSETQTGWRQRGNLERSLGWDISSDRAAVELLIRGELRQTSGTGASTKPGAPPSPPPPPWTHTFVVRMENSAEARAAMRDKQHAFLHKRRLVLSQFPSDNLQ